MNKKDLIKTALELTETLKKKDQSKLGLDGNDTKGLGELVDHVFLGKIPSYTKPKKKSEINKKYRLQSTIDIGRLTPEDIVERSKKRHEERGKRTGGHPKGMDKIRQMTEADLDKKLAELQSKKIDKNLKDTKRKLGKIGRRLVTPPDVYPSEIKTVEFMTGLADARHAELEAKKKRKKKLKEKELNKSWLEKKWQPESIYNSMERRAHEKQDNTGYNPMGEKMPNYSGRTGKKLQGGVPKEVESHISEEPQSKEGQAGKLRTHQQRESSYNYPNRKLPTTSSTGKEIGRMLGESDVRAGKVTQSGAGYAGGDKWGFGAKHGQDRLQDARAPKTNLRGEVTEGKETPKYSSRTGEKLVTGNQGSISKLKAIRDDALRLKYEAGAGQNGTSPRGGFYGTNDTGWNVRHNETIEKKPKKKV